MFLLGSGPEPTAMPDNSRAVLILSVQSVLITLCMIIYVLRIDTRWRLLNQLWWDDLFASLAMFFLLASFTAETIAVAYGAGQHINLLNNQQKINFRKAKLAAQPLWTWEMACIKLSVVCMFLRFTRVVKWKKTWVGVLWGSIAILIATCIVTTVFQLSPCRPFARNWDVSIPGECRASNIVKKSVISANVIYALTDFEFSLLPLTFIMTLHRPMRDKVAVAAIMGLGLLASIIGVVKFIGFNKLFESRDITWNAVPLALGSVVEANLAFIAANIPPLKSRGERFFKTVGGTILSRRGRHTASGTKNTAEPPTPRYAPRGQMADGDTSLDELSAMDSYSKEAGPTYKRTVDEEYV